MTTSAWSPLQRSVFRALWIAAIASNIGTWMQNVGGVWLMTSLTPSPLMVALMQTATSLPVFLIGLSAGALADIIDRRQLLLFWQGWMLVVAVVLGGLTLLGILTPWLLLSLTFLLGLGAAMSAPAWQAIIPELVPRSELPAAVALNGAGFNIARAVGPALGGLVVAAAGPAVVFLLNAVSFLGAVIGAAYLPRVRQRVSVDRLLIIATVVFAVATLGLAYLHNLIAIGIALLAGGFAWLTTMSSLNVATQTSVPSWVQARTLGIYQLVFQGGLAIGSAIWGLVAQHLGNAIALKSAAIGLILGLVVAKRYRLAAGEKLDLSVSHHWAEPVVIVELRPEVGPVLVTVEYHIDSKRSQDFIKIMHELSDSRKRGGAIRWGLFYDTAAPNRFVETFIVESWAEHLRQHERTTVADRLVEERIRAFLSDDKPPIVSHLIYARDGDAHD